MNANFLYAIFVFFVTSSDVFSQHLNDGSTLTESDVNYPDYQQLLKPSKLQLPARLARPRSPAIANVNQHTKVTPVPILKQINRHNEDGSYTYGFEGADGSFKIETKLASGEVVGKYGYVDDNGKVRIVEYGANKYGFRPAGEGITVPPITISNETETEKLIEDEESSQYVTPNVIKTNSKHHELKRKPQKSSPTFFFQEQRSKSHHGPSTYFVQEDDEPALSIKSEPNQKQFVASSDMNSLQYLLGSDFRESLPLRYRTNEVQQRKTSTSTTRFEENNDENETSRPFPQDLPIPAIFETVQVQQNDFTQPKYSSQFELPISNSVFKKPLKEHRSKQKPQFLLVTPLEEPPQQNNVRRNSNNRQENHSILDDLIKQYAIPNGSPAINDFSFSYN